MSWPIVERVAIALQGCDFDDEAEAAKVWRTAGEKYREEYRVRARVAIKTARAEGVGRPVRERDRC